MKHSSILITGGHLTPAIATIQEIQKRENSTRIIFVGRTHATQNPKDISHEKDEMKSLGISFYSITTGRVSRHISISSLLSLLKIPVGIIQSIMLIKRLRPSCIVSFGGYIALPVVFSGWLFSIPSITHEQTSSLGLANKLIARFARKICVTFREMLKDVPKHKGIYTGLPFREQLFRVKRLAKQKPPLLYVTGGSTGAQSINELIFPILPRLLQEYHVTHQTGRLSYEKAKTVHESLPDDMRKKYTIGEYFSTNDLIDTYSRTTLSIGRSGANTIIEVATLGIPYLSIPLPKSGSGEQQKNALWLQESGSSIVLDQSKATPDSLFKTIDKMLSDISTYQTKADALKVTMPHDGAKRFVDEIYSLL